MLDQETKKATADEKIAHVAKTIWRPADKAAIADKSNPEKQREEYRARKQLREVIDTVGGC